MKRKLDPEKIRAGVAACAAGLGVPVVSVRNQASAGELRAACAPYMALAALTLEAGAFGYARLDNASDDDVLEVMIEFLRATEEVSPEEAARMRCALVPRKVAFDGLFQKR